MKDLKKNLELLYELQIYDIKISNLKKQINKVLFLIGEKNKVLENKKIEMYVKNKRIIELNFLKKEKTILLDFKENIISKRSVELNTIKSNDIYKLMLVEIEKLKIEKGIIEDELIELMDKIDKESVLVKTVNLEFENRLEIDISNFKKSIDKFNIQIKSIEKEREKHKLEIDGSILIQYERLHEGCKGQVIAIVDAESCGGCGIVLRPQLINQTQKNHDIIFCDNCSRILLIRNEIT
jgi:predicted  nucleic acid-binding Zn-ribbon protein